MSLVGTLTPLERLKRARVQLQDTFPFFSYLVMHLVFIEDSTKLTAGIDEKGNFYYNPEWISKLSEKQVRGVEVHEVLHCAFEHFKRKGNRMLDIYNIASDIVSNNIILKNGLSLPDDVYKPENDKITIFNNLTITDLTHKTSEVVYDEIYSYLSKRLNHSYSAIAKYVDDNKLPSMDEHIYGGSSKDDDDSKDESSKGFMDSEGTDLNWRKIFTDAIAYANGIGKTPAGMERILGQLNETYIPWRGILWREITHEIPSDFQLIRPSRRSFSLGVYLPSVKKESIDLCLSIDTSGSIDQPELTEFISEIVGIIKSFSCINLTIIICDADIQEIIELRNSTPSDIISKVKLKGGGGTKHEPVFEWIQEHKSNARLLICFTDGQTSFPRKTPSIKTIWVLGGLWRASKKDIPFGQVLSLPIRKR